MKSEKWMFCSIINQGSYFLSYKKFHDFPWLFPWLFPSFPWLIIHNSVKTIQWNFCLSWYNKDRLIFFFIVINFSMPFHNSTQNSMTFQAWKAKKQNSMTFQAWKAKKQNVWFVWFFFVFYCIHLHI